MDGCCSVPSDRKKFDLANYHQARLARLAISGMGCVGCAETITSSLLQVDGVVGAKVDHALGTAEVKFIPDRVDPGTLVQAVGRAGANGRAYHARLLNAAELGAANEMTPRMPGRRHALGSQTAQGDTPNSACGRHHQCDKLEPESQPRGTGRIHLPLTARRR